MKRATKTYDAKPDALCAPCAQPAAETPPASPEQGIPKEGTAKQGAPLGNENATKHGLRSKGLALGKMPNKARGSERHVVAFRRWLLAALSKAGLLPTASKALVQAACRHETHAVLAQRWLRLDNEASPIETRLRLLDAIANATEARNAIIEELGLKPATGPSDASLPSYARGGAK